MSHFRAVKRSLIGGAFLTNTTAPSLTGIPRENEAAWIGAGVWSATPNLYRYTLKRDGVTVSGYPVSQAGDALGITWGTADVGHSPSATVEASTDSGITWSAPVAVSINFAFPSDLITPATIATPTLIRTSTAGSLPLVYRIDGVDLYDSYMVHQQRFTHAGAFIDENFIPVTESGLTSLTLSANATADPTPYPAPLGTFATDDTLNVSLVSADFIQGQTSVVSGVTSVSATVSPTDTLGAMTWSTTDTYSASAANTYSTDNLTITHPGSGLGSARSNRAVAFDLTYWEITGGQFNVGVADSSADLTTGWGSATDGQTPTTHVGNYLNVNGGEATYSTITRTDIGLYISTDVIQVALDRVNNKAWFGKNNTWLNGTPNVSGGLAMSSIGTPLYPAVQLAAGPKSATINAGTTPGGTTGFTYTPPTGFVAP